MKHLGTRILETERLVLRRFVSEDAEAAFRNWCSSDTVTKYLRWQTHRTEETTENLINGWASRYGEPEFYQWAIVLKEIDEPVGTISVVDRDDRCEMVEIGYCIGEDWWHLGITSEALGAVIDFFFNDVGVNRVEARHDANNPYSGGVMQKCGMKLEGILRQSDWNNQGIADMCIYGILRKEYLKK